MGIYSIADSAAADINNLWDEYVERGGSADKADQLIDEFLKNFQNLADFPNIGKPRSYLQAGTFALPYQKYIIFYRKSADGVNIVNVLDGRRDLERYFSEDQPDG